MNGPFADMFRDQIRSSKDSKVQGDPKQKVIFETDHTWPKNDFFGANWKFLLIWVYEYLLNLMGLH